MKTEFNLESFFARKDLPDERMIGQLCAKEKELQINGKDTDSIVLYNLTLHLSGFKTSFGKYEDTVMEFLKYIEK